MCKNVLILFLVLAVGCTSETGNQKYLRWVGDIEFDPDQDNAAFELCHGDKKVKQYFNISEGLPYNGEKSAIVKRFQENYKPVSTNQSGWVRVRFIVNCKGQTDRFRVIGADMEYQNQVFDPQITDQLLAISKELQGWKVLPDEENPEDYYQYLSFKIENGHIKEILP